MLSDADKEVILQAMRDSAEKTTNEIVDRIANLLNPNKHTLPGGTVKSITIDSASSGIWDDGANRSQNQLGKDVCPNHPFKYDPACATCYQLSTKT